MPLAPGNLGAVDRRVIPEEVRAVEAVGIAKHAFEQWIALKILGGSSTPVLGELECADAPLLAGGQTDPELDAERLRNSSAKKRSTLRPSTRRTSSPHSQP